MRAPRRCDSSAPTLAPSTCTRPRCPSEFDPGVFGELLASLEDEDEPSRLPFCAWCGDDARDCRCELRVCGTPPISSSERARLWLGEKLDTLAREFGAVHAAARLEAEKIARVALGLCDEIGAMSPKAEILRVRLLRLLEKDAP